VKYKKIFVDVDEEPIRKVPAHPPLDHRKNLMAKPMFSMVARMDSDPIWTQRRK
jgi:hypothetical protein